MPVPPTVRRDDGVDTCCGDDGVLADELEGGVAGGAEEPDGGVAVGLPLQELSKEGKLPSERPGGKLRCPSTGEVAPGVWHLRPPGSGNIGGFGCGGVAWPTWAIAVAHRRSTAAALT